MSGLNHKPSTKASGCCNVPSNACRNWKPYITKATGHKPIISEPPTAALLEDEGPIKTTKLENGTVFYLLPIDIVNVIGDWLTGLENYEILNPIAEHIKFPCSLVLRIHKHQHWVLYLYFRNNLIYQEKKIHWVDRYFVKTTCSFGLYTHLPKHNNA